MKRVSKLARSMVLTASFGLSAGSAVAQVPAIDPSATANPHVQWFNNLPFAQQQAFIAALPTRIIRDAATPEGWRSSTQVCGSVGPIEGCGSLEGNGYSVGLVEGGHISVDQDDRGWHVGFTGSGEIPVAVAAGVAGSATYYPDTGNVQVCGGAYGGFPGVATGSVQQCRTLDRERAQEYQDVRRWAVERQGQLPQTSTVAGNGNATGPTTTADQGLRSAVQNAYNVPEEFRMGGPNGAPLVNRDSLGGQGASDQLTFDENAPAQSVGNARPTSRRPEGVQTTIRSNGNGDPAISFSSPQGSGNVVSQVTNAVPQPSDSGVYSPRNGYDQFGNRANSPRQRYDANGNYNNGAARQNRAYSIDGSSRTIGRGGNAQAQYMAMQQWSNAQMAEQRGGGYGGNSGYGGGSVSTSSGGNAGGGSTTINTISDNRGSNGSTQVQSARLTFDDNAPRNQSPGTVTTQPQSTCTTGACGGSMNQSRATVSPSTNIPVVTTPTVNVAPTVAPRQPGSVPQTASVNLN